MGVKVFWLDTALAQRQMVDYVKINEMKKLMLLTAFIILFFTPIFSQTNGQFRIDTALKNRSILSYQKSFKLSDTIHFAPPFSGSLNNKHLLFPKFSERNFNIEPNSKGSNAQSQFCDKMPCIRPEGKDPMPVAKPDSTIRFSLLIKKVQIKRLVKTHRQ
jgi:hypothetical protein